MIVRQPVRRQGEPALGMICRTQAVKFPDCPGQEAVGKFIALAPPGIPRTPQKRVGTFLRPRQFVWQQAADAEQAR